MRNWAFRIVGNARGATEPGAGHGPAKPIPQPKAAAARATQGAAGQRPAGGEAGLMILTVGVWMAVRILVVEAWQSG